MATTTTPNHRQILSSSKTQNWLLTNQLCRVANVRWAIITHPQDKKYEGASHVCKVAPVPGWLEYTTRDESRERFGVKLQRCWSKNPSLRPRIGELFLAISLLVRDEAGKDEEIFPGDFLMYRGCCVSPRDSTVDRVKLDVGNTY